MSPRLRLVAVSLALLAPGVALARWMTSAGTRSATLQAPALATQIGPWTYRDEIQLSADHLAMLEPDSYLWRLYTAPSGVGIWVYAAFYGGRAGYDAGAHDPEVCYPAQGWEILSARTASVPLPGGERLVAKLLDAHHGSVTQKVLYWFQPAGRWPAESSLEQLARVADAIAGRPQYAFVRLAANAAPGQDATAEAELADFAARIAETMRAALEPEAAR
jgi:EpsI family protein